MTSMVQLHLIDQLLKFMVTVAHTYLLDTLEVSQAIFKRALEYLSDQLSAPFCITTILKKLHFATQSL